MSSNINFNYGADKKAFGWKTEGALHYAIKDANGNRISAFKSWGYIQAVQLAFDIQTVEQQASLFGPLSEVDSTELSRSATLTLTLTSAQAENLKTVLLGELNTIAATGVTDEELTVEVFNDGITPLNRIIKEITSVKSNDGLITYEENKNYVLTQSGLYVFSAEEQTAKGALEILAETTKETVKVLGKFELQHNIEGFTTSGATLELYFEGRSTAKSAKAPFFVRIHKAKFNPANFDILSDQGYGQFSLSAKVLADSTVSGVNEAGQQYSQFFFMATSR
jgi:hypothetical protein